MSKHHISRRKFLGQASCAALGTTTFLSTLLNLKTMSAAAGFNTSGYTTRNDYRALVCLSFSGGNDAFNMLIPTDQSEYQNYANTRSNLALPLSGPGAILPIQVQNTPGRTFGLHPSLTKTSQLFDQGHISFVSNVGTLIQPVTKQQVYNGMADLPLGLYSHSDQQMHWHTGVPSQRAAVGWGGKIADLLQAANGNSNISLNLSLSGSNLFQTGNETVEYTLDPTEGSRGIKNTDEWYDWWNPSLHSIAINSQLDQTYADPFKQSYKEVVRISRDGHQLIVSALEGVSRFTIPFEETYLSQSFHMVAKMIAAREALGLQKQIFFIDYGGWDHHDELLGNQAAMLAEVDDALYSFSAAIEELGLSEQVTTFSLSEFSRTLTSNGNGTDHAWGSNAFMMGGAVRGSRIFGDYPDLTLNNPLDLYGGVLIPTMSTDVYFAELALWFGVPASELPLLFPNIGTFFNIQSGTMPIGILG